MGNVTVAAFARQRSLVVLAAAALMLSCGHEPADSTTASSAALASTPTITFDLVYPHNYGVNTVAVGASDEVALGPSDNVLATDGSPGNVTSTGSGETRVGPESRLGNVVSVARITLAPNVTAISAQSGDRVELRPGDDVGTVVQQATLTPLAHRSITVHEPKGPASDVTVAAASSVTLTPGRYGSIAIGAKAVVTVSAGTYFVDDFQLGVDPGAGSAGSTTNSRPSLRLDTSGGTVKIYVKRRARWRGDVSGDATRFIFGLLASETAQSRQGGAASGADSPGDARLALDPGFRGTAVVPFGTLVLDAPPAEGAQTAHTFTGTFYGKHVTIGANVTVKELATPWIIDALALSKTTLCVGEQTEVSLVSAVSPGLTPWIQGVVGSHQFVAFAGDPGQRFVFATVFGADGRGDFTSVPVTVQECASSSPTPVALHFWGSRGRPDSVDLSVSTYDATGLEIPMSGAATYAWTFGDGQTATTTVPVVEHDYSAAVDPLAPFSYFNASVAVTTSAGTATSRKIIPIWSLYATNRAKGVVQPPSSFAATPSSFVVTLTNYEATPLTMTQAKVEQIPCDPGLDAQPQPPQPLSVVIPASATGSVTIAPPPPTHGICAVGMHLFGTTAAGDVRSDSYVRVGRNNPLTSQLVTDSATIALLNQASTRTADPNHFTEKELLGLVNQGALESMPPAIPPGAIYSGTDACDPANPAVGCECEPGDTGPAGLACERTPDWIVQPAEILNGFKGNFLMDHGCGNIGQLLASAGQLHSHVSMIVKNRVEVRHATMAEDRVSDHVLKAGLYANPQVLQFGWPGTEGTNRHSVSELANQYFITDPDNTTYRMGLEFNPNQNNKCDADITAVPPLLVRPDPACSPQPNLQGVVDQALTNVGHYRFFMYSHGDEPRSCTEAWCAGQSSTVCSLFLRSSAHAAGLSLWPSGPLVATRGPDYDGFNAYSEDVRMAGANAEWSLTYDKVLSKSWFAPIPGAPFGYLTIGSIS